MQTTKGSESWLPMRVGQAAQVEYEIRVYGNAMFEAEGSKQQIDGGHFVLQHTINDLFAKAFAGNSGGINS